MNADLVDLSGLTGLAEGELQGLMAVHGARGAETVFARLAILNAWAKFAVEHSITKSEAAYTFRRVYQSGEAQLPEWVYRRVSGFCYQTLFRWQKDYLEGSARLGQTQGVGGRKSVIESTSDFKVFVDALAEKGVGARPIALQGWQEFGESFPTEATVRRYLKRANKGA